MGGRKKDRPGQRKQARSLAKLLREREALAKQAAGGAPDRPIVLESASQVEPRAETIGCARCDAEVRVTAHEATVSDGIPLRVARVQCKACGAERPIWFRLRSALPN